MSDITRVIQLIETIKKFFRVDLQGNIIGVKISKKDISLALNPDTIISGSNIERIAVSGTAPTPAISTTLWYDVSTPPGVWKYWDGATWLAASMTYPGAGIAISTGSAWGTSITDNSSNWNTAYGWGNHASAGYLTSIASIDVTTALGYTPYSDSNPAGYITSSSLSPYLTSALAASTYQPTGTYATASNSMAFTNKTGVISQWTNDAGYITSSSNAATSTILQTARLINGVSFDGSANIETEITLLGYQALGSTIVAWNLDGHFASITSGTTMATQRFYCMAVYLPKGKTITGVKWRQVTQGVYTSSNYNGVGLYTYSSGTITKVASSTDDGTIWKAASGTVGSKAFSSTYVATAGLYFVGIIWSSSATSTSPSLGILNNTNGTATVNDFTNSAKTFGFVSSLTALPTTQAMSGVSALFSQYGIALY